MMNRTILSLAALFALGTLAVSPIAAQVSVPPILSFQGRLATPSGNPVPDNSAQTLTFRLYSALTGGTKYWEQISTNVSVKNGTFAVKFNFATGFLSGATLSSVFNGSPIYLEIKVGNDTALAPRQQLTSNAYAFLANAVPDGSITLSNLASGVLNFNNIGGTITNSQIGQGVITGSNLATGTITGDKIANNTIANNNLVTALQAQLGAFTYNPFTVVGSAGMVPATKVKVNGNYAYVSSYGYNTINIFNITNRTTPVLVAAIPCFRAQGLAISGNTLYVSCTDGHLRLFDITNPLAPATFGSIATAGNAYNLVVSGNYVYLTNYTANSFQIYNVSNPNSPTLAAGIGTDSQPYGITVSGNYAYITCSGSNTLEVFNVSNPAGPTFVGRVSTQTTPYDVKIVGNYAYVINLNATTLQTFNISNPASMSLVNTVTVGFQLVELTITGTTLYVCGLQSGLASFNLVNNVPVPAKITQKLGGDASGMTVDNGAIYLAIVTPGALEVVLDTPSGLAIPDLTVTDVLTASTLVGQAGTVSVRGQLVLDPNSVNLGNLSNGILFGGAGSGEGISSKRTLGGNTNGLDLYTSFTPRLSVTNGGAVGIGTTTPASTLEVDGDIRINVANKPYVLNYDSSGGYFYIDEFGAARRLVIKNGGNVGIGTTTPGYLLDVNGSLRCFAFTNSSDVRFKKNITDLADPLDSLLGLHGVSYEWRKDEFKETQFADGKQLGFIAQEVEKIFPELVSTDAKGYKSVNYLGVIPVLVEAVKAQQTQRAADKAEIAELKARLERLEAVLNLGSRK